MVLRGAGFGANVSEITVYLANGTGKVYQMRVLSVNDSVIRCGIPGGLPGNYTVEVSLVGYGAVPLLSNTSNLFTYELVITGITPRTGLYTGGTLITITGINFSPDIAENLVSIGNELNDLCVI